MRMVALHLDDSGDVCSTRLAFADDPELRRRAYGWAGLCHRVARGVVDAGLVEGRVVHGRWSGPVHITSRFQELIDRTPDYARDPDPNLIHHSWVELTDGRIFDPTRWAFFGHQPSLYLGANGFYESL